MSRQIIQLIEELEIALQQREADGNPEMRLSATEGLMQQIYCKTNPTGFEALVKEQLKVLKRLLEENPTELEIEVAEDFADKVWIMDIRTDMDELLSWEKTPALTWKDSVSHLLYIAVILMVLLSTLVGIKTIVEFLFLSN